MTARNPRRPAGAIIAARWAVVVSSAVVAATVAAALLGAFPSAPAAPAAHPCIVVGYATTDHAVLCADGSSRNARVGATLEATR